MMCGRYFVDAEEQHMHTLLEALDTETTIRTGEIFPTNTVPVIAKYGELTAMEWGSHVLTAKDALSTPGRKPQRKKQCFASPCSLAAV